VVCASDIVAGKSRFFIWAIKMSESEVSVLVDKLLSELFPKFGDSANGRAFLAPIRKHLVAESTGKTRAEVEAALADAKLRLAGLF
jgi:hypothetical protein